MYTLVTTETSTNGNQLLNEINLFHSYLMRFFAHLIQLRRMWMKVLSSWLFAQVSLRSILAETVTTTYKLVDAYQHWFT